MRILMATKKEIQRLKELGHSQREISKRLQVDRRTIQRYWDSPEPECSREIPGWIRNIDWDYVRERRALGVFASTIYEELVPSSPPSYVTFSRVLAKMEKSQSKTKIAPPRIKIPGEEIEIDYSGDSIPFISPGSGEVVSTELFVASLPYSQKFYAEFSLSRQLASCLMSTVNMFSFFGGVPKFLVVDNMKTAVTKYHKYDPFLNPSFRDMAEHYRTGIAPARPRQPTDKPSVERAVGFIQQHFFPLARVRVYHSLSELNRDLRIFLKKFSARPIQRSGISRDELFEKKEKAALGTLPVTKYEFSQWKKVKIHPDCHFQYDYNFYSVPYKYVGETLDIKFNDKTVTAFFEGSHVATHAVVRKGRGHWKSSSSHFPERKDIRHFRNLEYLFASAEKIGDNCLALVKRISEQGVHPLANYRKIMGIISLRKKCSKEAIEYACEMALEMNRTGYYYVNNCAKAYIPTPKKHMITAPPRDAKTIFLQGEFEHERDQQTNDDAEIAGNA